MIDGLFWIPLWFGHDASNDFIGKTDSNGISFFFFFACLVFLRG